MSALSTPLTRVLAVGLLMSLYAPVIAADEASLYNFRLVKAATGPNSGKPAELFLNREDGTSSTLLNAALLVRDVELPGIPGKVANSWGLSAAIAKNTLSAKRGDLRTLGAGVYSRWTMTDDKKTTLDTALDGLIEDDHAHGARANALVLQSTLRSPSLHYDPNLGPKESGVDVWAYPSVGLYRRRVSRTDDDVGAPVGRHGGAFVGLHVSARLYVAFQSPDVPLFDRVSLDLVTLATRDSSVSGGYEKATYRYVDFSINYLLYGSPGGKGWKPTIGLSRLHGTNRPANEPRQNSTSIVFKLSYGI